MAEFDFKLTVEGECPCGKTVQIGRAFNIEGAGPDGMPTVLHPLPFCKEYQDKDFLEYIRYVRLAMAAKRGVFEA